MVHLARYPLRLEVLLKNTPHESSDKQDIPKVVKLIREFLAEVNRETGRTENRFNLLQLDQQLLFRPGEQVVGTSNAHSVGFVVDSCAPSGSAAEGRGSRNDI
jgi:hypothetical protein